MHMPVRYIAPSMVSVFTECCKQKTNIKKSKSQEKKHLQQHLMQADINRHDSRKEQVQETQIHFDASFFWSR